MTGKGIILRTIRQFATELAQLPQIKDPLAKSRARLRVAELEILIGQQLEALANRDEIPTEAKGYSGKQFISSDKLQISREIQIREADKQIKRNNRNG